ncbi:MAG: PDZ domain-containing protein [Longimicrobiales bacterium]
MNRLSAILVSVSAAAVLWSIAPAATAAQVVYEARSRQPNVWLGLSYERAAENGRESIRITEVSDGSPAERAGIRSGDVLLEINELRASEALLGSIVHSAEPGDTLQLRVRREGRERVVSVIAAEPPAWFLERRAGAWVGGNWPPGGVRSFPESRELTLRMRVLADSLRVAMDTLRVPRVEMIVTDSGRLARVWRAGRADTLWSFRADSTTLFRLDRPGPWPLDPAVFHFDSAGPAQLGGPAQLLRFHAELGRRAVAGAEYAPLNPELGEYFGASAGLLVLRVGEGTPAARAGLEPGDVIVRAGELAVRDVADLRELLVRSRGEVIDLQILRKQQRRQLRLRLD